MKKSVWNLPNTITISRFFLCCLIFVLLALLPSRHALLLGREVLYKVHIWTVIVLFIAAALTDFLDGYLARKKGEVTRFGRVADPFVDKILVLGSMLFLCSRPAPDTGLFLAPWMVVVMLAREFLVSAIRSLAEAEGIAFPAERLGKWKLISQCLAVGWLLGYLAGVPVAQGWVTHVLVWAALLLTVISGLGYINKSIRVFTR